MKHNKGSLLVILLIVIGVLIIGFFLLMRKGGIKSSLPGSVVPPTTQNVTETDSATIDKELSSLDTLINSVDSEDFADSTLSGLE